MENITVAVVGAGVAGNFHCNALKQVYRAKVRLKTIVDTDTERAYDLLEKWGFQIATADFESVLLDPEIDMVCIALPATIHAEFSIKALNAGKHVICEKPLTGYFGLPEEGYPTVDIESKRKIYESLLKDMNALREIVDKSKTQFMYAETYLCAPNSNRLTELMREPNVRLLSFAAECSIHGSKPDFIELRKLIGDNSLMRLAAYPLSGVLSFKQWEARLNDEDICVAGVSADMGQTYANSAKKGESAPANCADAENFVNLTVTFSDGCEGTIYSCDKSFYDYTMSRMQNWIKLRCDDGYSREREMIPADNMKLYFFDQENYENARMQTDWLKKHFAEEAFFNYVAELNRFIGRAIQNRKSASGFSLAYDAVKIIHAAYLSAEEGGRHVDF